MAGVRSPWCQPGNANRDYEIRITAHGLDATASEALFARVAEALHEFDGSVSCTAGYWEPQLYGPEGRVRFLGAPPVRFTTPQIAEKLQVSPHTVRAKAKALGVGYNLRGTAGWRFTQEDIRAIEDSVRPPMMPRRRRRRSG